MQCPNCGGFRTKKFERAYRPGCVAWGVAWALVIVPAGFVVAIIMLLWLRGQKKDWEAQQGNPWYDRGYRCELCGYEWLADDRSHDDDMGTYSRGPHDDGPPSVNQRLILLGDQKLSEEAEARRRALD